MTWLILWKCEGISGRKVELTRIVSVSGESENSHCLSMAKNSIVQGRVDEVGLTNWSLTNRSSRLETGLSMLENPYRSNSVIPAGIPSAPP